MHSVRETSHSALSGGMVPGYIWHWAKDSDQSCRVKFKFTASHELLRHQHQAINLCVMLYLFLHGSWGKTFLVPSNDSWDGRPCAGLTLQPGLNYHCYQASFTGLPYTFYPNKVNKVSEIISLKPKRQQSSSMQGFTAAQNESGNQVDFLYTGLLSYVAH